MATRRHSEQVDINVRVNSDNAAAKIREISRSVLEAKALIGQPIRVKMNLGELSNNSKLAQSNLRALAGAIRTFHTLVSAIVFNNVVGGIVKMVDGYTNLENKVRSVLLPHEQLGFTMARLTSIANNNRTSLESVATVYSRTAKSVEDLGVSQSATLEFTKVLSQAVVVGGSTAVEAQQAMIQLSQGLASGALKGDELRSVLEQLPTVSKILAKEMGVTVGQLKKLGSEGKITTDIVFSAIINAGDEVQAKFDDLNMTYEQSKEVFKNNLQQAMIMFQPFVSAMAEGLLMLTELWKGFGDAIYYGFKNLQVGRTIELVPGQGGSKRDAAVLQYLEDQGFGKTDRADIFRSMTDADKESILKQTGYFNPGMSGYDYAKQQADLRRQLEEDEALIQQSEAMLDLEDLKGRFKPPAKKGKKEGGLTFEELLEKMRQEQEVERLGDYEGAIAKEFFQKMNQLKDSIREGLVTGAGKGGEADAQLQQLMEMIRAEHELRKAAEMREQDRKAALDKAKDQLKVYQEERNAIIENAKKLHEKDLEIIRSVDAYSQYNEQVKEFQEHINRHRDYYRDHPDQLEKITTAVEKMGYAYQTLNPIFENIRTNIADAAAQALVFGDSFSKAMEQIAKAAAAQLISSSIQMGFNALLGVPMPGITGGNSIVPPGPRVSGATGGYFPGYEYGGYTGAGGRGMVAGYVHGQEFVVNANATARNRALLESINSGKQVSSNVTVHNYAGVQVETATGGNGEIEIMIRKAVAEQTPGVMAAELQNFNSSSSKALRRNYSLQRRP